MAILSEGHILLDDVPGVGKTTLALAFSRVMGMQYHRVQFTPDVVPSDIVGFSIYNKATGTFDYKPGVVMTNLLLADEMIRLGISPRGALAVMRMAKAHAYLAGRDYVTPEDVQQVFTDVCGHRIILNPKARIAELTAEGVLKGILKRTKSPDSGR